MRSGYSYDYNLKDLGLWHGCVLSAIRGRRGQRLLRELLAALDALPVKRLIAGEFVDGDGDVCVLGAGGRRLGIRDIGEIDPAAHEMLGKRFDVSACLIAELEFVNDEDTWLKIETPEKRFARVRRWLKRNIKTTAKGEDKE
jgi:hypothetical protein